MHRFLVHTLGAAALSVALLATGLAAPAWSESPAPSGVVNVNTASAEQLMALPGIGQAKARAILEERDARGRFDSLEELMEVKGIGPQALDRLRPHLTLKGRTTLSAE